MHATHSLPRFSSRRFAWVVFASAAISVCSAYGGTVSPNVYAVTPTNNLLLFNSATPGTIISTTPVTGLAAGETILAMDARPATGDLFAIGTSFHLYSIDPATGVATDIGQFATSLNGTNFGFDFNPVVDRARVVIDATQNFRVNPNSGGTVDGDPNTDGTQPDTPLAYDPGDVNSGTPAQIGSIAYNKNFAGTTATTLFGIDFNLDMLVIQGSVDGAPVSPNSGLLTTVGPLGVDVIGEGGFDISAVNDAYAALASAGNTSSTLYTINLTTGAATAIGTIGGTELIRDIALAPAGTLQFSTDSFKVDEAAGTATITVQRPGGSDGTVNVNYATSDGTATAGADYTAASGTLTFAPGVTSQTFSITIANDAIDDIDETVNLTLSNADGGAVLAVQFTSVLVIQNTPTFTSFPVATGDANAALNVLLTAKGTQPITFSATGLPSGLVISGDSIVGTPVATGIFPVTITATSPAGTATQSLSLIITGSGISKTLVDVDADGFPDEIENGVGTSPLNTASTPFAGVPAGVVQPLDLAKLQIKLNFSKSASDGISFSGTLPVPAGFAISGQVIVVDVGGVVKSFTMDAKGQSPKADDSFKIKIKASKGVVAAQTAKFQGKFNKGNFGALLVDEGLANTEAKSQVRSVPVIVLFNQIFYKKDQPQLYTAKVTKSGRTKQPR